ncbi:MAG: tRNA (N(6)-L-threonylcarbamoyladenosine(37)-C(2))-methylthiotransferase MtaB [Lentisphaeria bacterium]
MPNASVHTLGCRLNQADSALLANGLTQHGYQIVPWGTPADLLIINSCTITSTAAQKSRQALRTARKNFPDSYIVFMGCDANLYKNQPSFDGFADLILPNPKPQSLFPLLPHPLQRHFEHPNVSKRPFQGADFTLQGAAIFEERTRANLKIQDGCNFCCSYCIVPQTRGPAHSRDVDDILRETKILAEHGYKEIVLTGVNIATYKSKSITLPALIEKILAVAPGFRLRLGSTEPGECLDELVDMMAAQPRVCRFLHLPIQYGENSILKKMRRHYTTEEFSTSARRAAAKIPGLCLGTDFIVGFPGETDAIFSQCKQFLTSLPFGLMHVFIYSPRQNTPAIHFPNRPQKKLAHARSAEILKLATEKTAAFAQSQIGQTLPVLIEHTDHDEYRGWSDNYLDVHFQSKTPLQHNQLVNVTITAAQLDRKLSGNFINTL